jgi:hypothetical protein
MPAGLNLGFHTTYTPKTWFVKRCTAEWATRLLSDKEGKKGAELTIDTRKKEQAFANYVTV